MKDYRVEKTRARVTLRLRDGLELSGSLYLPVEPADEPFVGRIRQLLDEPDPFLPFEMDGADTVLQHKERLLWCRYDGPQGPVVEVLEPRRRVTLVLDDGTVLQGDLVAAGPPDRRRVLDCLNHAGRYVLLEGREGDYLVRRDAIAVVPSGEEGEPRDVDVGFELESPATVAD